MMRFFSKTHTSIKDALKKPEAVKHLHIQDFDADLNKYASDFPKLINLETLDIHVSITHPPFLPSQIGKLQTLKRLTLLNIPFEEFPDWIQNLENLQYLRVRGCALSQIPSFIGTLQKLKYLGVENCELSSIPKELRMLSKLKELNLSDTKIAHFPLEYLPTNLKYLNLSGPIFGYSENELCRLKKSLPKVKISSIIPVDCNNLTR